MAINTALPKGVFPAVLTTPVIDAVSRINTSILEQFGNDVSLRVVLRLLLWDRLPEGEDFYATLSPWFCESCETMHDDYFCSEFKSNFSLYVFTLDNLSEKWLDEYDAIYQNEINAPVSQYLKKHGYLARCYRYNDIPYVLLGKEQPNRLAALHTVISCLPSIIPEYFKEKPLTEKEKDLLRALSENSSARFCSLILDMIKDYDWEIGRIKALLEGFENGAYDDRIRSLEGQINDLMTEIERYEDAMRKNYDRIDTFRNELLGISLRNYDKENELLDVFLTNKSLHLVARNGRQIEFSVVTYLDNFDPDLYETCRDNERSLFNNPETYNGNYGLDKWRGLMDAIFLDQKIKPVMGATFMITFGEGRINARTDAVQRDGHLYQCLPNPHLTYFTCFGNNKPELIKALRENNSAYAIAICTSVASNLNLSETNNTTNFIHDLYNYRDRDCLELPDGTRTNLEGAFAYLEKEKNNGTTA